MPTSKTLPFCLYPLDPKFVPPKPKNSVKDEPVLALEKNGKLIKTRKRDGHYVSAVITGKGSRLYSRGKVEDLTANFPHIEEELLRLKLPPGGSLFCCELIAEQNGRDNREYVASLTKLSLGEAIALQEKRGFARLMAFNPLILGGADMTEHTNTDRITIVQDLFGSGFAHLLPVEILEGSFTETQKMARKHGWEGQVLYDADGKSAYRLDGNENNPPRPIGCWKRKPKSEDDFVATGWVRGTRGKRHEHRMGKLNLAQVHPVTGILVPCGEVGIGFGDDEREYLANDRLYPLVAQVEFERRHMPKRLSKGRIQCALCNPNFLRRRDDKEPSACLLPEELKQQLEAMGFRG